MAQVLLMVGIARLVGLQATRIGGLVACYTEHVSGLD